MDTPTLPPEANNETKAKPEHKISRAKPSSPAREGYRKKSRAPWDMSTLKDVDLKSSMHSLRESEKKKKSSS